jgi:hypothetical protein
MHHENTNPEAAEPTEIHPDSSESTQNDQQNEERQKRNCGRTGATTPEGRATAARNAMVHGMTAKTLIIDNEDHADWLALLYTWLEGYNNPAENSLLYTFVLKTAQAEWFRLRIQREFDSFLITHVAPPISSWSAEEVKKHDLILRYLTTARRTFQSEYRMLEHHYKTHHKPQKPAPEPEPERTMPSIRFINNETGESVDEHGNEYPPPPDWKPVKIIPGVYGPKHPANPLNWPKEKPRRR